MVLSGNKSTLKTSCGINNNIITDFIFIFTGVKGINPSLASASAMVGKIVIFINALNG